MEGKFYAGRLADNGIDSLVPNESSRQEVNRIIFDELCKGVVTESSTGYFLKCVEDFKNQGAQAIVLGCTELVLSIPRERAVLPLFDTTELHCRAAVELALSAPG